MTPTLLLVEADIVIRGPLAAYLRECGFRVLEASTGGEARTFADDETIAIDVVLADVNVQGENGFALSAWMRNRRPGIEIVLAASAAQAVQRAGELCEGEPLLTKPYDHQSVLDRIRRAIAARERSNRQR